MIKEEFKQKCKDKIGSGGLSNYDEFENDLDSVIAQAIAEHERKVWKKYPENKPEDYKDYNVTIENGGELMTEKSWYCDGDWMESSGNVIAFRELPAPYQPEEGGER